jgi:hypothetical protein
MGIGRGMGRGRGMSRGGVISLGRIVFVRVVAAVARGTALDVASGTRPLLYDIRTVLVTVPPLGREYDCTEQENEPTILSLLYTNFPLGHPLCCTLLQYPVPPDTLQVSSTQHSVPRRPH